MSILIVEDDLKIASFVQKGLKEAGYHSDITASGDEALYLLSTGSYQMMILDLMILGKTGLEVLSETRSLGNAIPILILSAKRSVDDRVLGLQSGADDYLVKPFSFLELLARVQVLLKRSSPQQGKVTQLEGYGIQMDLLKREVKRNQGLIDLQPKEFSLLEFFLRNPEKVLSKTMILENVYGYNFDTQTNVVDVLVSRLRTKIDKDYDKKLIHTIRGVGYVLKEVPLE